MANWNNIEKALGDSGGGWTYDETEIEYDSDLDPLSNLSILYEGIGTSTSITNVIKSL